MTNLRGEGKKKKKKKKPKAGYTRGGGGKGGGVGKAGREGLFGGSGGVLPPGIRGQTTEKAPGNPGTNSVSQPQPGPAGQAPDGRKRRGRA